MKPEAGTKPCEPTVPVAEGNERVAGGRRQRKISSAELLAGAREIHILHANEVYTLRQTSKGKLILTK